MFDCFWNEIRRTRQAEEKKMAGSGQVIRLGECEGASLAERRLWYAYIGPCIPHVMLYMLKSPYSYDTEWCKIRKILARGGSSKNQLFNEPNDQ